MLTSLRRTTALWRGVRALSTSSPSVRGLMAGLTHGEQGMSFQAAYDVLGEMDAKELADWEAEWLRETGQRLRFASSPSRTADALQRHGHLCRFDLALVSQLNVLVLAPGHKRHREGKQARPGARSAAPPTAGLPPTNCCDCETHAPARARLELPMAPSLPRAANFRDQRHRRHSTACASST